MEKLDAYAKIKKLVNELNKHTELYDLGKPIISDVEWDKMYFELEKLERDFNYIFPNSPTQKINYTVVNELQKVHHNHPMLSLDKTKDVAAVKAFVGKKDWLAMLKMDGLTCSLLYDCGKLIRAETRGDGEIGEDVTHNAMVIPSIPKRIPYTERLVVDGEIICKLDDFAEFEGEYKNARNFASGSIRLLDSSECAKRKLTFVAWDVIGKPKQNSLWASLDWLRDLSFKVVPFMRSMHCAVEDAMCLKQLAETEHYPIDGLVFKIDNVIEYELMGRTDHHFRGGLAFKFYNELYETKLEDVEWTLGKTSVLTPTAIFKTVQIDGCDISRASLHNISIIKKLGLTNNCTVKISKRNEIIPQVEECLNDGTSLIIPPKYCPVCGGETAIVKENESEILVCTNPNCSGKLLGRLKFFVSKPAMNIDGLSEATLDFLINKGWVKSFKDIYHLATYKDEWQRYDGFGKKSVEKMLDAIEKSRNINLANFICALSIDGIGTSASKTIANAFNGSFDAFFYALMTNYDWSKLPDFGTVTARNIADYGAKFTDEIYSLAQEMKFVQRENKIVSENPMKGKKFCITGSFSQSRDLLKQKLEAFGAVFVSGVSKNLDVLFCGEKAGSKLTKAQNLGVRVAYEDELMNLLGE